jgi:hypothetical protein
MPRAVLMFQLPQEDADHRLALDAPKLQEALDEMFTNLKLKLRAADIAGDTVLAKHFRDLYNEFMQILIARGFQVDEKTTAG